MNKSCMKALFTELEIMMPDCSVAGLLCRIIPAGFVPLRDKYLTSFTAGMAGALKMTGHNVSLRRTRGMVISCSVFAFNFYSPGQDYGSESILGVEKTVITENKFTFSFIEIPLSKGICHLFSLLFFIFVVPKSFKTIAASIIILLSPPCRVREISDPPST